MIEDNNQIVDNTVVNAAKMDNKVFKTNDQKVPSDKYSNVHKTQYVDTKSCSHKLKDVLCIAKRDSKKSHKTLKKAKKTKRNKKIKKDKSIKKTKKEKNKKNRLKR